LLGVEVVVVHFHDLHRRSRLGWIVGLRNVALARRSQRRRIEVPILPVGVPGTAWPVHSHKAIQWRNHVTTAETQQGYPKNRVSHHITPSKRETIAMFGPTCYTNGGDRDAILHASTDVTASGHAVLLHRNGVRAYAQ
jgi:hypothetical protein